MVRNRIERRRNETTLHETTQRMERMERMERTERTERMERTKALERMAALYWTGMNWSVRTLAS